MLTKIKDAVRKFMGRQISTMTVAVVVVVVNAIFSISSCRHTTDAAYTASWDQQIDGAREIREVKYSIDRQLSDIDGRLSDIEEQIRYLRNGD
jgi:hypothetical protein